jgi:uncharacterized cupredoxin-like copper-binding protein
MRAVSLSTAALVAGAVAVAGCGGNDNNGGASKTGAQQSAPSGGATATVKLTETEFKIAPASPSVRKTGTVTFVVSNKGQTVHALEVDGPGGEKKTGNISPGQSARLKVDLSTSGTYEFYCPIDGHKDQGMKGEIRVADGGSSSSSSGGGSSGY